MAHQKAIACVGRRTWVDRSRDTVERPQRQPIAAVRHIKQQAVVATPRVFGSEDANIGRKVNTTVTVARSELNIGDAVIEGMSGIHREMRRPVELNVKPNGPKFPPASGCRALISRAVTAIARSSIGSCLQRCARSASEVKPIDGSQKPKPRTQSAIPLGVVDCQGQRAAHLTSSNSFLRQFGVIRRPQFQSLS
jgi:hypothetical protein